MQGGHVEVQTGKERRELTECSGHVKPGSDL